MRRHLVRRVANECQRWQGGLNLWLMMASGEVVVGSGWFQYVHRFEN